MAVPSPGNAVLQCVHQIPGGMFPGKVIKVRGSTPLGARKFDINLQCGPNINLHDDIALHLSVRFFEGCVIRNHLSSKSWGSEERGGGLPINRGELFEASILCGPNSFQVALNGVKFYEFTHRLPFQRITHITVDGDVMLISVDFESARSTSPLQKNMLRIGEEYVYSVVQFLELPYAGIDDYVCVPYSWIRVRRTTDHKVMVAYPVESPLITKRRIERTERASEKWSSYIAIVKYETNSYDDAYVFILTTNLTAYNTSTENRCSNVKNRDDEQQLPVRIIQINNSSLKRTKISERKPENQQKKMRVTEKAEFESLEASKCSNIESGTGMLFTPSSHVSAEKMTVQMTNKNSSSSQGVSLETDTMSSVCLNSCSGNRALLSQAHCDYTQQDPRRQGFLDGDSTSYRIGVITKSALLKGSTANTVFTVQDPSNPSYQPFQLSKHQNHPSVHRGPSMPHLRLQETSERTNDTQFTNPGILSQNFSDNPPLVQFSPIIIANQNFQTYQQPQANQFLSVYKDYLQNIPLNKDIHKRTSSNSNTFPSYISTNQNCVRGDGSMLTVQNPSSVAIRSSQMPMSSLCPNHLPVPLRQEKLVGQTSGYPEFLPVTENRSHQNTLVSGVYVDEPLETNCIKQSIYYQRGIENEPFATSNSPNKANQSCQSVQKVVEGGLSTVDKDTTGDMLSTQYFEGNEQSDPIERNPEGESTASQKSSNPEKQSLDSHLAVQQSWFDEMADIFDQISSDFFQTCKAADDLRDSLIHSAKTFQRIANLTANLRKVKKSEAHATAPKNVTMEVREVTEKCQSQRENQEGSGSKNKGDADSSEESDNDDTDRDEDYRNSDEDDEDDSEHDLKGKEAMKKIRGHIRSFVLPPEYDPDDTKWTLQHRNPDSKRGIIELVPQSGVYVDAIKLSNCKRISKDCKTLARMLLVEIFSRSALSVCSLTGARANVFDTEGAHVRPGLDQHARMVLMTYVEDHSKENNWPPFSTQSVTNSIRSKIQEIRTRYGKTK